MGRWNAMQTDYDELQLAVEDAIIDLESLIALMETTDPNVASIIWQLRQVVNRLKDD